MKKILWNEGWTFQSGKSSPVPVCLPHDAMLAGGRAKDAPSGQAGGYFLGGNYHYQKRFTALPEWRGKTVFFETEGIYPSAEIYLNGEKLGTCGYGYLSYRFPLQSLKYGGENVLDVKVSHTALPDSRWYSGGGMYRPVSLWVGGQEYIEADGIRVTTLAAEPARIRVDVACHGGGQVKVTILRKGEKVAEGAPGEFTIPGAALWSAETPNLYRCKAELVQQGGVVDEAAVLFGIRTLEWSARGLFVNGNSVKLRGGCIHHDNGILGARTFAESEFRRVRRLKDMGFNAVRSSHNPAGRYLLEACDRLGMYVMDEAWDMWDKPKTAHDYARSFPQNWSEDISRIVAQDYNHPCVILYSIGNEVTEPKNRRGVALGKQLIDRFHGLDATRPVTCGINITLLLLAKMGIDLTKRSESSDKAPKKEINSTAFNEMMSSRGEQMSKVSANFIADRISSPILDALDIAGYNYASARYEKEGKKHPNRPIIGTETYAHKLAENWRLVEAKDYLIGDFMWTAWDYLGEAGIGGWTWSDGPVGFDKPYPWLLADTGAFDILGNETAEAGNAAVIWNARPVPYIAVMPVSHPWDKVLVAMWRGSNALPYWSYKNCEGKETQVEVYSRGDTAELFLNGVSVGKEALCEYKAVFHPRYAPGELKAVAYDKTGRMIGESVLRSAEPDTRIQISPEKKLTDDDICYFSIDLVGANGEIECNADTILTVTAEGGELLAFGSANPKTEEDFLRGSYRTYYGRAQAVVRRTSDTVSVYVSGGSMEARCTIAF